MNFRAHGDKVRAIREELTWTQPVLDEASGVRRRLIQRIEDSEVVREDKLTLIADAFTAAFRKADDSQQRQYEWCDFALAAVRGEKILELRQARKWDEGQLSQRAHVEVLTISRAEAGDELCCRDITKIVRALDPDLTDRHLSEFCIEPKQVRNLDTLIKELTPSQLSDLINNLNKLPSDLDDWKLTMKLRRIVAHTLDGPRHLGDITVRQIAKAFVSLLQADDDARASIVDTLNPTLKTRLNVTVQGASPPIIGENTISSRLHAFLLSRSGAITLCATAGLLVMLMALATFSLYQIDTRLGALGPRLDQVTESLQEVSATRYVSTFPATVGRINQFLTRNFINDGEQGALVVGVDHFLYGFYSSYDDFQDYKSLLEDIAEPTSPYDVFMIHYDEEKTICEAKEQFVEKKTTRELTAGAGWGEKLTRSWQEAVDGAVNEARKVGASDEETVALAKDAIAQWLWEQQTEEKMRMRGGQQIAFFELFGGPVLSTRRVEGRPPADSQCKQEQDDLPFYAWIKVVVTAGSPRPVAALVSFETAADVEVTFETTDSRLLRVICDTLLCALCELREELVVHRPLHVTDEFKAQFEEIGEMLGVTFGDAEDACKTCEGYKRAVA